MTFSSRNSDTSLTGYQLSNNPGPHAPFNSNHTPEKQHQLINHTHIYTHVYRIGSLTVYQSDAEVDYILTALHHLADHGCVFSHCV